MTLFPRPTKAVIPASGFGRRFLPQTKAMPREMLPLVDKPVIQYIVERLVEAGITDIIIVTNFHKRVIDNHFDVPNYNLLEAINMLGDEKNVLLDAVNKVPKLANIAYIRQKGPIGNGTPLLNIAHFVGNEPFIYTWGDMIDATPNEYEQLIAAYERYGMSALAYARLKEAVPFDQFVIAGDTTDDDGIVTIHDVFEKPAHDHGTSKLKKVSSIIFTPDIFPFVEKAAAGIPTGQEFSYIHVIKELLQEKHMLGVEIKNGKHYDLGNKLEYMEAVVEYAAKHKEIGPEFLLWLKNFVNIHE